ncbi:unnamed protein product [Effrenium voratum]|uniref:Uncharacterized protein n=1 Tax=Effrenium voratum TaxID=2562239 RepID=A0AA36JEG4_9DINO|nr:unnamed protein product [Effrenium voratum]
MGQGVSVEADPLGLKELLGAPSGASHEPGSLDLGHAHHVKAWRFETRGKSIVEAPVSLCDSAGVFCAQLHRSSSYVILHIQGTGTRAVTLPPSNAAAINEFAAAAGATCTPRGLAAPEIRWSDFQPWPGIRYSIFVWHGRSTEPLFRASVLSKAYELDSLLRKTLPWQRDFIESFRRSTLIKGCQDVKANESSTQAEDSARNGLLANLTADAPEKHARLWPRLGRAIRKDLGTACLEPTSHDKCCFSCIIHVVVCNICNPLAGELTVSPMATFGRTPAAPPNGFSKEVSAHPGKPGVPQLTGGGGPPAVPSLATPVPAGRPVVPRLALGSLGAAARPAATAATATTSPTATSGSSVTSSEGMEVDEVDSSSSRKRQRGDEADESNQRTPQTARPSSNLPSLNLAAAPRTARDGVPQVPQLAIPGKSGQSPKSARSDGASKFPAPANGLRSEAPALNLEDIHTPEDELSYDPENEENNYHLPDHLQRRLQLKHWRQVCSEVVPKSLYISSYQVACDEDALRYCGITHIVNTAADICDNCFPEKFTYLTYYLKDVNSEDISVLLYRTLEWINEAITRGGRVLVHCREGVSRSATIVIAYLMWKFSLSFEAAHERIRQQRPICNPNTGFTCQLLQLHKRLASQAAPMSDRASLFRVAPYHQKEPFLLLVPAERQSGRSKFDPRFGWVAQSGQQFALWMGSQVPDADAVQEAVQAHIRRVDFFERCQCSLLVVQEGEEVPQLWQVLGETPPADRLFVALRPEFDPDYDLMAASRSGPGSDGHRRQGLEDIG